MLSSIALGLDYFNQPGDTMDPVGEVLGGGVSIVRTLEEPRQFPNLLLLVLPFRLQLLGFRENSVHHILHEPHAMVFDFNLMGQFVVSFVESGVADLQHRDPSMDVAEGAAGVVRVFRGLRGDLDRGR